VRINAVNTKLALEDMTAVLKAPYIDSIVVPKVDSASDVYNSSSSSFPILNRS